MAEYPDLQHLTQLIADKSRLDILSHLMDGRYHTTHELAKVAKITDPTCSYHLAKLSKDKWLTHYKQGKSVYYQLFDNEIANLLESLMNLSPKLETHSYNSARDYETLKGGRTCYHHLAGKLGVQLFDHWLDLKYLTLVDNQITVTKIGGNYFTEMGLNLPKIKAQSGIFAKPCMDWTERRFHLSGNLAKAFLNLCLEKDWILRSQANRAVMLTESGNELFYSLGG